VARVEGYIQKLFVFSRGELVEKDAPLVTLYSPDLLTTQNEFLDLLRSRDQTHAKTPPGTSEKHRSAGRVSQTTAPFLEHQ